MLDKLIRDWEIDNSWTLFLDRDGVINHEKPNAYITKVTDFKFIDGVLEAIAKLTTIFGKIIVVTNQQGIGKGLMSEKDFQEITQYMTKRIQEKGGRIDKVYHSPYLSSLKHEMQKPRNGMGFMAQKDFPQVNFSKSVTIGNGQRDMEFGKSLGTKCIFVGNDSCDLNVDFRINKLVDLITC